MYEFIFAPIKKSATLVKKESISVASTLRQKGVTLVAHTTKKILSLLPLLGDQIVDGLESETLDFQECPAEVKLRELPKVEDCYE